MVVEEFTLGDEIVEEQSMPMQLEETSKFNLATHMEVLPKKKERPRFFLDLTQVLNDNFRKWNMVPSDKLQ